MDKLKIKGFKSGLMLNYCEDLSFEEACIITKDKFSSSRKFFGNATMAIKFSGKNFSEEEQMTICNIITDNCDIDLACILCDDISADSVYNGALKIVKSEMEKNDILFCRKSIINGNMVKSAKDIVIIGDVNPGCTVVSEKSIYIFGGLYGEAFAGVKSFESEENNSAIICALEMAPEELRIGNAIYEPSKKSIWGHKTKLLPSFARVVNGHITVEPYTKEIADEINSMK